MIYIKNRNIGILAHVDAGKTTLTENLLFCAGVLRHLGSVERGTCATDSMGVERRRGISVRSACARATLGDTSLCFIDTPGHVDFAGEVERSLGVLDGAVLVLSAVEGVQAHTRLIWNALQSLKVPTIIVINKIDRVGSDTDAVLSAISSSLCANIFAVEQPLNEGTQECSVVLRGENGDGSAAEELLLLLNDEQLMEQYLAGDVTFDGLMRVFRERCALAQCCPVLFTSAKMGVGVPQLLEALSQYLPDSSALDTPEMSGLVFKVEYDRDMGKGAYVRLFGGELKARDSVTFGNGETGKIAQIRTFIGTKAVDSGVLRAGETGIVYGLSGVRNADIIGSDIPRPHSSIAVPLLMVTAHPEKQEMQSVIMDTLRELSDEDPLLHFEYNRETREMYLSITGIIQLEILEELVYERCAARVMFSDPAVIFKETPRIKASGYESYTMPKPCWAQVELTLEPLARGEGVTFESVIKDKTMPYRYQHHVELSSTRDCVKQGIYGWEVIDTKITLTGGGYHHIHTHPLDFFVATPIAFLRALTNCGSMLLEPYVRVTLSAQEDLLGKVLGQIIDMRGEFGDPSIENGTFTLEAVLPVLSSMNYPIAFRSLTSGKGIYSSSFCGYRECPKELYRTMPRRGADPLDKPQWILYCRNCMSESL